MALDYASCRCILSHCSLNYGTLISEVINPYLPTIFTSEIFMSAVYIQVHFRLDFIREANSMNTDQTALSWEQSGLWPYCLQYVLPKNVNGRQKLRGAQWLSGRVLDSRQRGCGFKPHRHHCVMSLSKTHLSLLSTGSTQELLTGTGT